MGLPLYCAATDLMLVSSLTSSCAITTFLLLPASA